MSHRIALDAMSGDHGIAVVVPAALQILKSHADIQLTLVGDSDALQAALPTLSDSQQQRLNIYHASQVVEMDELPSSAMRNKKDSSMRVAIELVKKGEADACVSAGNTGALMATARYVLKTLPGIDRPAISTVIPHGADGHVHMLDLGANIDVTAAQLMQFAVMGNELVSAVDNLEHPRIGLLNIGQEEIKGNETVKEAAQLLSDIESINYIGFVEGDAIFSGDVDVVVCDGFVGNVALKTMEGVAKMLSHYTRQGFTRTIWTKLAGLVARPVLSSLKEKFDPRRYNGASLLGLRGIVIKSHGGADELAFAHAIKEAIKEAEKNVPNRISDQLAGILLKQEQAS